MLWSLANTLSLLTSVILILLMRVRLSLLKRHTRLYSWIHNRGVGAKQMGRLPLLKGFVCYINRCLWLIS